jgi:hypothetical protein
MRQLIYTIIGLALLGGAFFGGMWYIKQQTVTTHNSDLVIENIERIWKLSTVEADVSELYKFKDYQYYDFSPFRKEALVRVNAKVAAGFDFDQIEINIDEDGHQIIFDGFPNPEILSVDHTLEYYDIKQGTFNSFSPEELSALQQRAKDSIQSTAVDRHILNAAAESKDEIIDLMTLATRGLGWEIIIKEGDSLPILD